MKSLLLNFLTFWFLFSAGNYCFAQSKQSDSYNEGVKYLNSKEYSKAIEEFDKALLVKENDMDALYNRGIAKIKSGDTLGACNDWKKGYSLFDKAAYKLCVKYCGLAPDTSMEKGGKVFTVVESMPEFPGGTEEIFRFISSNLNYPPQALEYKITGTVYVSFVVSKTGTLYDVKILRGIGGGCDEEAVRIIKAMPLWKPGIQNGEAVDVQYNLPVKFILK